VLAVTLILLASPSLADDLPAIGIDGSPPCTLQNFGKSPCTMSTISIGDALLDDDIKLHFKHESLTRGYFVFEPYQMQLLREIKGLRTELADLQRDASGHLKYLCKRNTCK